MEFIAIKFQGSFGSYVGHLSAITETIMFLLYLPYSTNHSFYQLAVLWFDQVRFVDICFPPLISLNHYQKMSQDSL